MYVQSFYEMIAVCRANLFTWIYFNRLAMYVIVFFMKSYRKNYKATMIARYL